jgi:hypothetical protein
MEESYFSEFGPRENHDDDDDADADAGDDDDDEILDGFLCG